MGREFLVFADAFGYCPIFYSVTDTQKLLISDSFHGIAAALQAYDQRVTVNVPYYVSSITSRLPQFQNIYSEQTMANEIHVLPPDKLIHVCKTNGVRFYPRAEIGKVSKTDDYLTAVESGVDLATSALRSLTRIDGASRRITLSGGVDSRLVLSLLISAGLHHQYGVFSVDPRTWTNKNTRDVIERDIALADLIRSDHSMSWWHPGDRTAVLTDFSDSLAAYQSHRSNLYFLFRPTNMLTVQNQTTVTLRGGGGETFSSSSSGIRLSSRYEEKSGDEDPASWLARYSVTGSEATPAFRPIIQRFIKAVYRSYEQDTMQASLDNHFYHSRNRAHFGHMNHSRMTNEIAVQMLSNPYFLRAADLVSNFEKAEGKIVSDIFKASTPEMLDYAFESSYWSSRFNGHAEDIKDAVSGRWMHGYDATKRNRNLHVLEETGQRTLDSSIRLDAQSAATNYLKFVLRTIEDLVPQDVKKDLAVQHASILKSTSRNRLNLYHTVSKAASVIDAFVPQPTLGAVLERSCDPNLGTEERTPTLVTLTSPRLTDKKKFIAPIFEQKPTIHLEDNTITVSSNFRSERGSGYQFAFYLVKDGKRIAQRWYEDSTYTTFENIYGPGSYEAVSHVRYRGEAEPTFYEKTESIDI